MKTEDILQGLAAKLGHRSSAEERCRALEKAIEDLDTKHSRSAFSNDREEIQGQSLEQLLPLLAENCEGNPDPVGIRLIELTCGILERLCASLTLDGFTMATYLANRLISSTDETIQSMGIRCISKLHPLALYRICFTFSNEANAQAVVVVWNELGAVRKTIVKKILDGNVDTLTFPALLYLQNLLFFTIALHRKGMAGHCSMQTRPFFDKYPSLFLEETMSFDRLSTWARTKVNELRNEILQIVPKVLVLPSAQKHNLSDCFDLLVFGIESEGSLKGPLVEILITYFERLFEDERNLPGTFLTDSVCVSLENLKQCLTASPQEVKLVRLIDAYSKRINDLKVHRAVTNDHAVSRTCDPSTEYSIQREKPSSSEEVGGFVLTAQGKVKLSKVVDTVLDAIIRMQDTSSNHPSKHILGSVSSSAKKVPHQEFALSKRVSLLESLPLHDLLSNSLLGQQAHYTHFLMRSMSEIISHYRNSHAVDERHEYAALLKNILLQVGKNADIFAEDSIFTSVAMELIWERPLIIQIMCSIYLDSDAKCQNAQPQAIDVSKIAFWERDEPFKQNSNVYDALLSLCVRNYISNDEPESPSQSAFYEVLLACPAMTTRSWMVIVNTLLLQVEESQQTVEMAFHSLALLTAYKPAIQGAILSVMIHCGSSGNTMVREIALRTIHSYLPLNKLYKLHSDNSDTTQKTLSQLLNIVATNAIQSLKVIAAQADASLDSSKISDLQAQIDQHVSARCALPFYSGINQKLQFENLLRCWSDFSPQMKVCILNSLQKNEAFHEAIIVQCTQLEFHRVLTCYFSDCQDLVVYLVQSIAEYFGHIKCALGQGSLQSDVATYYAAERLLVETTFSLLPKASSQMEIVSFMAQFMGKNDFYQIGLPVILESVISHQRAVEQTFLGMFHPNSLKVTPGEVFVQLHLVQVSDENFTNISRCIDILIRLHNGEEDANPSYVLGTEPIVGGLRKLSQLTPWPVLLIRSLIQCLDIHTNKLLNWSLNTFLPTFISKNVWETDPTIWNGIVKVIQKYLPDSISLLLRLPQPVLRAVVRSHEHMKDKIDALLAENQFEHTHVKLLREKLNV